MPTTEVMRQIVMDVATAFPKLQTWQEIYLTPRIMVPPSPSPLEIQVAEVGMRVLDTDGEVRREQFNIDIGILRRYALDAGGRHAAALATLADSIFDYKATIISTLDGSFLTKNLLVRPLVLVGESPVVDEKETLVKIVHFIGGMNVKKIEVA